MWSVRCKWVSWGLFKFQNKDMKYRIVKITKGTKDHYEVQKRGFLCGWNTETFFDCCIDGSMAGNYPIEFKSMSEAESYIKEQYYNEQVCKVL